jgi:hypothetical protein
MTLLLMIKTAWFNKPRPTDDRNGLQQKFQNDTYICCRTFHNQIQDPKDSKKETNMSINCYINKLTFISNFNKIK